MYCTHSCTGVEHPGRRNSAISAAICHQKWSCCMMSKQGCTCESKPVQAIFLAGPFTIFNEADERATLRRWFDHMREVINYLTSCRVVCMLSLLKGRSGSHNCGVQHAMSYHDSNCEVLLDLLSITSGKNNRYTLYIDATKVLGITWKAHWAECAGKAQHLRDVQW